MRKPAGVIWEPLVDAVVDASWNNRHGKAAKVVKTLLKAMRDTRSATTSHAELMKAFYRLIDFYCMEDDYEKAYGLCENLLKAQQDMFGTNDPRLMDTLIRIAKINQLRKENSGVSAKPPAVDLSAQPLSA
ncbi:MAG TPA: hypothetical protein PKZ32_12710 [Candidatus Melainabacteria bacterium]|nr:hypothetical protein [Candidatus Melainabacteria bacterium]